MESIDLPEFIFQNISIRENTYYKMGGVARYFAKPRTIYEVQQTLFFCKENKLACALLGSGSNSVYADGFFNGLILSFEKMKDWYWETKEILFVEAGVTNTEVAEICTAYNRAGAAWMFRMPGQIGATVRMNARCYGGEISEIAMDILTLNSFGEIIVYKAADVFHGYKKTLLMNSPHIVLGVRLFFPKELSAEHLLKQMFECETDRHNKHHFDFPSCGSTFKNNYDLGKPSGKVFDELGFKGKQIGQVAVSKFHANFIWNFGEAKTSDLLSLTADMRAEAKQAFQTNLELEVQPVGSFSSTFFEQCGMEALGPCYDSDQGEKLVGLFYFPQEIKNENQNKVLPKVIFSSFFNEYNQTPYAGQTDIYVSLTQLQTLEEAKNNPHSPFLKWETHCRKDPNILFPLMAPAGAKELWHYSVSEIFFASGNNPAHYLEFEITPLLEYIALKFDNIRVQAKENYSPLLSTYSTQSHFFAFGINFSYTNLDYVFGQNNFVLMQCALSLGNQKYYLGPLWKQSEKEQPDFHQPQKYWKLFF